MPSPCPVQSGHHLHLASTCHTLHSARIALWRSCTPTHCSPRSWSPRCPAEQSYCRSSKVNTLAPRWRRHHCAPCSNNLCNYACRHFRTAALPTCSAGNRRNQLQIMSHRIPPPHHRRLLGTMGWRVQISCRHNLCRCLKDTVGTVGTQRS